MFEVKKEKCDQCLFTKNRIVGNERASEILKSCKQNDSHFICHKASINGEDVCCRGFYDSFSTNMIRIAGRLRAIKFVD